MGLSPRAKRLEFFNRIHAMRRVYSMRGPLDGQTGITPDGTIAPAIRWSVSSVVGDAVQALSMDSKDLSRWRAGMGLDKPIPFARRLWSEDCPSREPGLSHKRESRDDPGVCAHCKQEMSWG